MLVGMKSLAAANPGENEHSELVGASEVLMDYLS